MGYPLHVQAHFIDFYKMLYQCYTLLLRDHIRFNGKKEKKNKQNNINTNLHCFSFTEIKLIKR